jgi:hypothetical protein
VESSTLEEMRALRLKYPSGAVNSELVPTLRDLLTKGRGRILFLIELKGAAPGHFPELLEFVQEVGATDHVLFWVTWRPELARPLRAATSRWSSEPSRTS